MAPIVLGLGAKPKAIYTQTVTVGSQSDSITRANTYWGTTDPLYWISNQNYNSALRFTGLLIPQGAKVLTATLSVFRRTTMGGMTANDYVEVGVEQIANPAALSSLANHQSRETNIGDTIQWALGSGAAGSESVSPNLAAIVQEVVDLPGWSGNIMFFNNPNDNPDNDGQSVHSYYSGTAPTYPKLFVEYEA